MKPWKQWLAALLIGSSSLCAFTFVVFAPLAHAEEEAKKEGGEGGEGKPTLSYVDMTPPFVTNFQIPGDTSKMHFLKVDVSVRVPNEEAKKAVEYHMAYLRNQIVFLLSKQTQETLSSNEGKEKLRLEALAEVQDVLKKEEGEPLVEDLLFTSFIMQR